MLINGYIEVQTIFIRYNSETHWRQPISPPEDWGPNTSVFQHMTLVIQEMFYWTTHSTHFIYGYGVSDIL